MADWDRLYKKVRSADSIRRELALRDIAAHEDRAAFDEWCERVTDLVLTALRDHAIRRAREFEQASGHVVYVKYPSHDPIGGADGPSMKFMRFALDGTTLHLYSHRAPGSLPYLHWAVAERTSGTDERSRLAPFRRRIESIPSCMIVRLEDEAFELRSNPARGAAEEKRVITVDDVVFQAFDLLVDAAVAAEHRPAS